MSGASAFIAPTRISLQIDLAPRGARLGASHSYAGHVRLTQQRALTHRVWARFSQPRMGMTSARSKLGWLAR